MNKNIVHIGHAKHLAEKLHWAEASRTRGDHVSFLGYDEDPKYQRKIVESGFPFESLGSRKDYDTRMLVEEACGEFIDEVKSRIITVLSRLKPDIAHIINVIHLFTATSAVDSLNIPSVTSTTGLGFVADIVKKQSSHKHLYSVLEQSCTLSNGIVTFQNQDDATLFLDARLLRPAQCIVVPGSGIDTEVFQYSPEPTHGPFTVTQIGRVCAQKGVDTFIGAANILAAQGNNYRFTLVGGIDSNAFSPEQLRSMSNVEWHDHTNNVAAHIHSAHVVCLAAIDREGAPRSLLEANACGRPIITTDIPGCTDIVEQGVNGLLIQPESPKELAEAISFLRLNPAMRAEMGENGRQLVSSKYASSVITAQFKKCYDVVLRESQ